MDLPVTIRLSRKELKPWGLSTILSRGVTNARYYRAFSCTHVRHLTSCGFWRDDFDRASFQVCFGFFGIQSDLGAAGAIIVWIHVDSYVSLVVRLTCRSLGSTKDEGDPSFLKVLLVSYILVFHFHLHAVTMLLLTAWAWLFRWRSFHIRSISSLCVFVTSLALPREAMLH